MSPGDGLDARLQPAGQAREARRARDVGVEARRAPPAPDRARAPARARARRRAPARRRSSASSTTLPTKPVAPVSRTSRKLSPGARAAGCRSPNTFSGSTARFDRVAPGERGGRERSRGRKRWRSLPTPWWCESEPPLRRISSRAARSSSAYTSLAFSTPRVVEGEVEVDADAGRRRAASRAR